MRCITTLYMKANEIRKLEDMKALVNQNDTLGKTALSLAAQNGYTEIVELLLKAGANAEVQDNDGGTPMHRAAWGGHVGAIELLRKHTTSPAIPAHLPSIERLYIHS